MNASLRSSNQCKPVRKEQKLINTCLFGWCRVRTGRDRSSLLSFLEAFLRQNLSTKGLPFPALKTSDFQAMIKCSLNNSAQNDS